MRFSYRVAAVLCAASISCQALAADKWAVQPVQTGDEAVRYLKGVPTVDLERNDGVVQITPLPLDHGSLAFGIAVYNDGLVPANLGVENIRVSFADGDVEVFTADDMVRKAKNRATWSTIGLALLGGLAAGAAASQTNTYRSTLVTPRGTYTSWFSAPSVAGQFQATAISASTGVSIARIQNQLDNTIASIGDQFIQLTTVDPGESYAGQIVIEKIKPKILPANVTVTIDWNGESYPFTFQIAKRGAPAPKFIPVARKSDLTDYRQLALMSPTTLPTRLPAVPMPNGKRAEASLAAAQVAPVQASTEGAPVAQPLPSKPVQPEPKVAFTRATGTDLGAHLTCVTCRK